MPSPKIQPSTPPPPNTDTSLPQPQPYSALNHRSLTSSRTGNNFYFAYGSNLSPSQMRIRCPNAPESSVPVAIARLDNWKWIICERGYANVVELPNSPTSTGTTTVYGLIYDLSPPDECLLDTYEGASPAHCPFPVPNPSPSPSSSSRPHLQGDRLYNKLYLPVTITKWLRSPADYGVDEKRNDDDDEITTLIYVDEKRVTEGRITPSYVGRMNRAIRESVQLGVPEGWVREVMRRHGWVREGVEVEREGYVGGVPGHERTWTGGGGGG